MISHFRLVEEEEISGEVKAEFKEKAKVRQFRLLEVVFTKYIFSKSLRKKGSYAGFNIVTSCSSMQLRI